MASGGSSIGAWRTIGLGRSFSHSLLILRLPHSQSDEDQRVRLQSMEVGKVVKTPWSNQVVVLEVVCDVTVNQNQFLGVITETRDIFGWPISQNLLWLYKQGDSLLLWQDFSQRPRAIDRRYDEIRRICGFCQLQSGVVYYAIEWPDYGCPTWELEEHVFRPGSYTPNKSLREF